MEKTFMSSSGLIVINWVIIWQHHQVKFYLIYTCKTNDIPINNSCTLCLALISKQINIILNISDVIVTNYSPTEPPVLSKIF